MCPLTLLALIRIRVEWGQKASHIFHLVALTCYFVTAHVVRPLAHEAIAFFQKAVARLAAILLCGDCRAVTGRDRGNTEAEPLLAKPTKGTQKEQIKALRRYHLDRAHEWLVQLYQAWSKPDKSAEWAKRKP